MGETLKENSYLDIEAELMLVEEKKRELHANKSMENDEAIAMKEMGMRRFCNSSLIQLIVSKIF